MMNTIRSLVLNEYTVGGSLLLAGFAVAFGKEWGFMSWSFGPVSVRMLVGLVPLIVGASVLLHAIRYSGIPVVSDVAGMGEEFVGIVSGPIEAEI